MTSSATATAATDLATLTRRLGAPELDLAILGEGNTSIRVDADTFLVKASGYSFADATEQSFVRVRFAPVLALLEREAVTETELKQVYAAAKVDQTDVRRPSVETVFHAFLLTLPGVNVVAHTHPVAVNGLTCAQAWPDCFRGRLFPDEAVVLGPEAVLVPYIDPGVILARAIRDAVRDYQRRIGASPKQILMQNHGLIALGASTTEAWNVTAMAVKAARIRAGALASGGGLRVLGEAVTAHLLDRPDEKYRQGLLAK